MGSNNIYWSKPFRITGETGKPGVDGSNMQFVYALSNIMPNFPGEETYVGKCNFCDSVERTSDGFVYNGTKWFDNPQGIAVDRYLLKENDVPILFTLLSEYFDGCWSIESLNLLRILRFTHINNKVLTICPAT